jgi:hypothetical protein
MPYPSYPYPPQQKPSNAMAYASALVFAMCSVLTLTVALLSWDGTTRNINVLVSVPGFAFTEDFTGNVDFAITFSMIMMGVVALLALLLALRLQFARVLLAVLGGIMVLYFIYWLIKMLIDGGGDYAAPVVMSLLLWLVAEVMTLLPLTSQAMRRRTGAAWSQH